MKSVDIRADHMFLIKTIVIDRLTDFIQKEQISIEMLEKESMSTENRDNLRVYLDWVSLRIKLIEALRNTVLDNEKEISDKDISISVPIVFIPFILDCIWYNYWDNEKNIEELKNKQETKVIKENIKQMYKYIKVLRKIYDELTKKALAHKDELEWLLDPRQALNAAEKLLSQKPDEKE